MIFISKKAFENEVEKRMAEIHFKNNTDEKIWKMEEDIRNLRFRVDCLEERNRTPVPKVNYGSEQCCSTPPDYYRLAIEQQKKDEDNNEV